MKRNLFLALLSLPLAMGAQGDGCAANSKSPAPDVRGTWSIAYDNTIGIEVKIGGVNETEVRRGHAGLGLGTRYNC